MKQETFFAEVQQQAHLDTPEEARRATTATLETLAERIDDKLSGSIAVELPDELGELLQGNGYERFDAEEFFQKVAERSGVEVPTGSFHAKSVLKVLGEALGEPAFSELRSQLPREFVSVVFGMDDGGSAPQCAEADWKVDAAANESFPASDPPAH